MEKTIKPYEEDGSKKAQVSRMFDNIAPYYDFLNRLLSLGIDQVWRKKAIAQLGVKPGDQVLDVATGTADVALQLVRSVPGVQVIGLDISKEMLEIGNEKIAKRKLSDQIELQLGDSENLIFPDNTFDGITVAFGVRNFEHLRKGLKEMQRVLKPGGRLVVLEFSKPRLFPFKQLFNFYFKNILPVIGRFTSKDPKAYQYLYESVQAFPDGAAFIQELQASGFGSTEQRSLSLGICSIYTAKK